MRAFLAEYYYGAWKNFYQVDWPIRFLIEWIFFLLFLILIMMLLKNFVVRIWYFFAREIVYLLGHEKAWAVAVDIRLTDWALKKTNKAGKRKQHLVWKAVFVFTVAMIYFLAVLQDLPVARHISMKYLSSANSVKIFFVQIEAFLSKGYEQYPPLLMQTKETEMPVEEASVEKATSKPEEKEPIFIKLNDRGGNGSNIRSKPDLEDEENVVGGVNKESEILYGDEVIYDGERYWIRVYIPMGNIEGWLSGNLIDSGQLKDIVEGKME